MNDIANNETLSPKKRKKHKAKKGERGVALLMVMTAVGLLYILAAQTREDVQVSSAAAFAARDHVQAYYQAKSIVNLSRLFLHSEPTIRRVLNRVLMPIVMLMSQGRSTTLPQIPIWEQADLVIGAFRNREGASELGQAVGFDSSQARGLGVLTGAAAPVIIDEDSKINLNGFDRGPHIARRVAQQLMGLMANGALDPYFTAADPDGQFTDRATLAGAIIDFADANSDAFDVQSLLSTTVSGSGSGGQEDTVYSNFRPSYQRKNAPFDSLEELRLVRGMSSDDLWQSIVDPDPGNPSRRTLTVWGQGLVNVNTANAQTLLALICAFSPQSTQCSDASQALQFMTGISMIQGFTLSMGIPLFGNARQFVETVQGRGPMGPMLTSLGVQPFTLTAPDQLERAVTTESKVFSVYAEASVGYSHVRIHTVVDMRAQPAIPGTFMTAIAGQQQQSNQTVTTQAGNVATISSAGGTLIYWRED